MSAGAVRLARHLPVRRVSAVRTTKLGESPRARGGNERWDASKVDGLVGPGRVDKVANLTSGPFVHWGMEANTTEFGVCPSSVAYEGDAACPTPLDEAAFVQNSTGWLGHNIIEEVAAPPSSEIFYSCKKNSDGRLFCCEVPGDRGKQQEDALNGAFVIIATLSVFVIKGRVENNARVRKRSQVCAARGSRISGHIRRVENSQYGERPMQLEAVKMLWNPLLNQGVFQGNHNLQAIIQELRAVFLGFGFSNSQLDTGIAPTFQAFSQRLRSWDQSRFGIFSRAPRPSLSEATSFLRATKFLLGVLKRL
jgi:hypothetical protein